MIDIACDIDGVIIDFWPSFTLWVREGQKVSLDITDEQICLEAQLAPEELVYFYNNYQDLPAIEGAIEGLQQIKATGVRIHLITARLKEAKELTQTWLDRFAVPYDTITYCPTKRAKVARAQYLDCLVAIDDHPWVAIAMAQMGITSLLLDTPYNRTTVVPTTVRRTGWEEIPELVAYEFSSPASS